MAKFFSVKVKGEKEIKNTLDLTSKYVKSPKVSLKEAIMFMKDTTEGDVFNTEGSSIGHKWARLTPSYATWKSKRYPGKKILETTGKMRKNFKTKVSSTRAVLSNPTSYFKYHQLGTRKMKQRLVLTIDSKREREIMKIFEKDTDKILSK